MLTKLDQFTKLRPFSTFPLFCPNFVTIFCRVLKMKIFLFDIPSYPPPIAVQNLLTNQFRQKRLRFCIFKKKKRQSDKFFQDPYQHFCIFLLLKINRNANFFGKIDWSMNSGPQWAGNS